MQIKYFTNMSWRIPNRDMKASSPNRAYLASAIAFAQIPRRGTSDTLVTLGEMS
jgi:hypothetical protein